MLNYFYIQPITINISPFETATATVTVKNNSDSAITLDTFTASITFEE